MSLDMVGYCYLSEGGLFKCVGVRLVDKVNPVSDILKSDLFDKLKSNNDKVVYMGGGTQLVI